MIENVMGGVQRHRIWWAKDSAFAALFAVLLVLLVVDVLMVFGLYRFAFILLGPTTGVLAGATYRAFHGGLKAYKRPAGKSLTSG